MGKGSIMMNQIWCLPVFQDPPQLLTRFKQGARRMSQRIFGTPGRQAFIIVHPGEIGEASKMCRSSPLSTVPTTWSSMLTTFDNTAENYKYIEFSCSAMEERKKRSRHESPLTIREIIFFWQGGCRHLQQYRGKNTVSCHILAQHDETWGRKDGGNVRCDMPLVFF